MKESSERMPDPVCGMLVQPDSPFRLQYRGVDYVFCSDHCLDTFKREPGRFLEGAAPVGPEAQAREAEEEVKAPERLYLSCPLHPEVREPAPRCPKCGGFLQFLEK